MPLNSIAYFVSSHGFGHAARSAAVMQAVAEHDPSIRFEIFTAVPAWFFKESLSARFNYHYVLTDFGLAQKTPFYSDLKDTLGRLDAFYPISRTLLDDISAKVRRLNCRLIICDIAPLGLLVAANLAIASVLVENFTWDWIYRQYADIEPGINRHIAYLKPIFESADYHIQTEPVCRRREADLLSAPVSRKPKMTRSQIRGRLGLRDDENVILITTGGLPQSYDFIRKLDVSGQITFVMPGAGPGEERYDNLIILPHHSKFYHPDLVNAADAVIGKVGYSTLAEVFHSGIPFGYVARENFNESEPLVDFVEREMSGLAVTEPQFHDGSWISITGKLLELPRVGRKITNGAEQAGEFISALI